ncbi:unnamed protein product, partial [marine sediment metagenome]
MEYYEKKRLQAGHNLSYNYFKTNPPAFFLCRIKGHGSTPGRYAPAHIR